MNKLLSITSIKKGYEQPFIDAISGIKKDDTSVTTTLWIKNNDWCFKYNKKTMRLYVNTKLVISIIGHEYGITRFEIRCIIVNILNKRYKAGKFSNTLEVIEELCNL